MMEITNPIDRFDRALGPFSTPLYGALGGLAATAAMTLVFGVMQRLLPSWQRRPVPPYKITTRIARRLGLKKLADEEPEATLATTATHFGYGALSGAIYAPLQSKIRANPILKGTTFGLLLWAISYQGWLPATGLLRPVPERPLGRNMMLVVSHLVFGTVTALVVSMLEG